MFTQLKSANSKCNQTHINDISLQMKLCGAADMERPISKSWENIPVLRFGWTLDLDAGYYVLNHCDRYFP